MSFLCPRCSHVSYGVNDEREGYCGHCNAFTALKAGDVVRVRPSGTEDEWVVCSVALASTNGQSLALSVQEGALRADGIMLGMLAVTVDPLRGAVEVFTNTPLDIEGRV